MARGQVWIETVVYTLIGLSLIALVLALITPRINEYKDRAVIEQTISALDSIDGEIQDALKAPGNVRTINFAMKRGDFYVDSVNDTLTFRLDDSRVIYSQPGEVTSIGKIQVLTEGAKKPVKVSLTMPYSIDLIYPGQDVKKFSAAATPYHFSFSNNGLNTTSGKDIILVSELSR
jgi:type II secretory pathway pseudopilin PulG